MTCVKSINISQYQTLSGYTRDIALYYQTFGDSAGEAPVVLVIHALTGNSNVTGKNGWWQDIIGEDKCIDTNNYSVLAFNVPGNGHPNNADCSIHNYKDFTARDIATIFALGLEQLGVKNLFACIGGSVGGGIAWELAALKPSLMEHLIPVATHWKSTDWLIANCHIQDAILKHSSHPLADARMHAMTLYRTPESLAQKFKSTLHTNPCFKVESWLNYHGNALANRFSVLAYKMMNQILASIDICRERGDFLEVASSIRASIHIVTINTDLFFKPEENWKTYVTLKSVKDNVNIHEIKSIHGHDAFLIEFDQLITFLKPLFKGNPMALTRRNTHLTKS